MERTTTHSDRPRLSCEEKFEIRFLSFFLYKNKYTVSVMLFFVYGVRTFFVYGVGDAVFPHSSQMRFSHRCIRFYVFAVVLPMLPVVLGTMESNDSLRSRPYDAFGCNDSLWTSATLMIHLDAFLEKTRHSTRS